MRLKGQMDEFAWILIGAMLFILLITLLWMPSNQSAPTVDPKSIELNLIPGSLTSFFITVNGSTGKMSNINLTSSGEIGNWLSFDSNNIDVENPVKVKVNVIVPKNVIPRTYTGTIKVSSTGGENSLSIRINVIGAAEAKLRARRIELESPINIRYSIGTEPIGIKENVIILRSFFTEYFENTTIFLSSEQLAITTGGYVNLTIKETRGEENLIVFFNGYQVFNNRVGKGELIIPIDKSIIGGENNLVIKTFPPPWYKFWTASEYKMDEVDFALKYKDVLERERSFDLKDEEVANFKSFRLTGTYRSQDPMNSAPLIIKINNQLIYSDYLEEIVNRTFEKDVYGDMLYLKTKDNIISFTFNNEARYKFYDAALTIYFR